jgi:hypothetical protein
MRAVGGLGRQRFTALSLMGEVQRAGRSLRSQSTIPRPVNRAVVSIAPPKAGRGTVCPRRGIPNSCLREDSHPKGRDVFRLGAQPIAVPALAGRAQPTVLPGGKISPEYCELPVAAGVDSPVDCGTL